EFRRFIGEGSPNPEPTAIVLNPDNQIVGWIDYDVERAWLAGGEVNIGYNTFPNHRGRGYAVQALGLLIEWIAEDPTVATATLLIDPANEPSIGVAHRAGFEQYGEVEGQLLFKRDLRQR
ncbi:MAG: GNAT family N-acetyltransferase, partial [Actinomycetia bacterium]|nr:GNAT family N-acetyltransferase [Actinomycetes bacterium]